MKSLSLVLTALAEILHVSHCKWSFDGAEKLLTFDDFPWPNPLSEIIEDQETRVMAVYELDDDPVAVRLEEIEWFPVPMKYLSDEALSNLSAARHRIETGFSVSNNWVVPEIERTPAVQIWELQRESHGGWTDSRFVSTHEFRFLRSDHVDGWMRSPWPRRGDAKLMGPIHCGWLATSFSKQTDSKSRVTIYQLTYRKSAGWVAGLVVPAILILTSAVGFLISTAKPTGGASVSCVGSSAE